MDNKDYYKREMVTRYSYLYENSSFIFSFFMRKETAEEYSKYKQLLNTGCSLTDIYSIDLNLIDSFNLFMLESALFEDKPLEETMGYKHFETIKYDYKNNEKIKKGMLLKEEYNTIHKHNKLEFDIIELLFDIYENISRQSSDIYNKENKLRILDEYIRIAKYTNDNRIWTGGYFLSASDHISNNPDFKYKFNGIHLLPDRQSYDVGIKNNKLIEISKNIVFSQKEKQKLYLKYKNEIPNDLEIRCSSNGIVEIDRPYYSKPCNRSIDLNKQDIFSLEREKDYVFLTLCPRCMYLVGIHANLIPIEMQEDIVWNNKKDPKIYLESYLKSELKSLKK